MKPAPPSIMASVAAIANTSNAISNMVNVTIMHTSFFQHSIKEVAGAAKKKRVSDETPLFSTTLLF